jgi:hypothetical protein
MRAVYESAYCALKVQCWLLMRCSRASTAANMAAAHCPHLTPLRKRWQYREVQCQEGHLQQARFSQLVSTCAGVQRHVKSVCWCAHGKPAALDVQHHRLQQLVAHACCALKPCKVHACSMPGSTVISRTDSRGYPCITAGMYRQGNCCAS